MSMFKFQYYEDIAHVSLQGYCYRVQHRLPGVEMTEVKHMATYSLFATDHQCRLLTGSTNSIKMVVEVASGNGHHDINSTYS